MNIIDKTIWITGASSGIGRALSIELSKYNLQLIVSARNKNALEEVKKTCEQNNAKCFVQPLDLSDANSINEAQRIVFENFEKVDILINNGGISQRSFAHQTDIEIDRKIMEVNYFGNIALTKAVLPKMIAQKSGHLVTVSSPVGVFGFPLRSAYSASKHAMHGFYETLAFELKKYNIKTSIILPGRIKTNVSKNALTKDGTKYGKMDDGQNNGLSAEKCAKKIIKGIKRNKKEIWVGKIELIMIFFKRKLPFLFNIIANKIKPT